MSRPYGLRLVSRTPEEEAAIERPSPAEDANAATNHASWKFTLLETVNADPKANSDCFAVVAAYLSFTNREKREAYLSEADLQTRTGGLRGIPLRALRTAKKTMVRLGYMTAVGATRAGIVIYRFDNPRQETVAEHMAFTAETLKEMDAEKKRLARLRRQIGGRRIAPPKMDKGGADLHGTGGADLLPNTVEQPVESILYEGEVSNRVDPWGVLAAVDREMIALREVGR